MTFLFRGQAGETLIPTVRIVEIKNFHFILKCACGRVLDKCECDVPDIERKLRMQSECVFCTVKISKEEIKEKREERQRLNFELYGKKPRKRKGE